MPRRRDLGMRLVGLPFVLAASALPSLAARPATAGAAPGPVAAGQPAATTQAAGVPLWGRFETRLANNKNYDNPFRDVTLDATFTSPSGRKAAFFGFYDGDGQGGQEGNVWKLRFMPDEVGAWTYSCAFSDGTPGAAGQFACTREGARPGPLHIVGNGFGFPGGKRFLPRSYYFSEVFSAIDPNWQEGIDSYFGPRHRFNLCCTTFWQTPLLLKKRWNALSCNDFYPVVPGDYTRLHLKSWHHADEVLSRLEERNIIWFNFDGFVPNEGNTMGDKRTDFECQKVYIRNVMARIAPYWNQVWNLCFEWSEIMPASDVRRLAEYVRGLDPWKRPITVHDQGQGQFRLKTPKDYLSTLGVDFITLQYDAGKAGDARTANEFVQSWMSSGVPVYAQEVCWEDAGKLNAEQLRRGAWGVVLAGGIMNYAEMFNQVYGDGKAFPFVEVVLDFMESIPWWELAPHNELVSGGAMRAATTGPREWYSEGGPAMPQSGLLCAATPGRRYVCYSPDGATIELDLSAAKGSFDAQWLEPRTGKTSPAGRVEGGAKRSFACPDKQDWVLHVVAQ